MEFGKLKGYYVTDNEITLEYEKRNAIIQVIKEDILNIFVPVWSEDHRSKAIEGEKAVDCDFTVSQDEGRVYIETDCYTFVAGDEFYTEIQDQEGKTLLKDYTGERKKGQRLSQHAIELLEAEGHDVAGIQGKEYPIFMMKELPADMNFYGLGDKSGFLNKRNFEYENWNSDIPQAHNEDYKALYKSIPFLICKQPLTCFGLFFDNTFRSGINLGKECVDYFYYGAEDGNLDYYFLGGSSMAKVIENYTYLTGRTPLPQLWTLGYMQCRWGYECAGDIREVAEKYRQLQIPCESVQYDIDYMDGYRVFTWNEKDYGKKGDLFRELGEMGYKPVVIIDPGVKVDPDYFMSREGKQKGYFALDPQGEIYVNEVWPGDSNYPDFGRKEVRQWWADAHKFLTDMGVRGVWNDMNEPASFRGELPQDVVFHEEDRVMEHREMHNVYGHYMCKATFQGLKEQTPYRPFVITRACYAGSQKYTTVWTGDNQSLWHHLQMVIPQLCNLGMSGFAIAGTDIGGFGADCNPELLCRWIEAAIFSPFLRNHSAKGAKRQEPWQFGPETEAIYRKYVNLRYQFLPYLYDLLYQGEQTGLPVMRPLVLHYEENPETYNLNTEFLVGENLLVAPVLEQGARRRMIYLPEGTWYDYWTGEALEGGQTILRQADLDCLPMYVKAGSILPTYELVQYVGQKPYDKLVLLTTPGQASYCHFQDNGEDYSYREGAYNLYRFTKSAEGELTTEMLHQQYPTYKEIEIHSL